MKIFRINILIAACILLGSCEKLVEIDPPEDFLMSDAVFQNDESAIAATIGVYATIMNADFRTSYNLNLFAGLYSDELSYNQTLATLVAVHKYAMTSRDALTNPFWTSGFKCIYQTNSIIAGLNKSNMLSEGVKKQLLGEALFLRAFWYYYLSLFYGPLPLITTTDYAVNSKMSRAGVDVIQEQMINDLLEAKSLLSDKFVAANSISESPDRIRANTFTVSALLARIYLQMNKFDLAESEASLIISSDKFSLPELSLVFKRTSKEVILQLELPSGTGLNNSYEAFFFQLSGKPGPTSTFLCSVISPDLLSLFTSKDKRRSAWIGTFVDNTANPAVSYPYPSKLKSKSAPADEYTTPFRLAEIFLIRAEARAQLSRIPEAVADVDRIRFRSGLDQLKDILPGITKQALLDSINNERRRELFCEWGNRWSDIRRSTNAQDIMKSIASKKGAEWKASAILWPLPLNEILNSANALKQNDGYE